MARNVITRRNKAIEWTGLKEIEANVNRLLESLGGRNGRGVGLEVKRVLMGGALVVRDEAKDLVPVRTGLLKDSIFAAYGDDSKPDVLVGVNHRRAPHSHLIEYGTVKMQAQPFMRPAITATRGKVIAIVAEGLKKILDKALP
jgi:HK97 gp10 family phage protein